jgi:hypothetical protein
MLGAARLFFFAAALIQIPGQPFGFAVPLIFRSLHASSRNQAKSEAGAEACPCAIHSRVLLRLSTSPVIRGFCAFERISVSSLLAARFFLLRQMARQSICQNGISPKAMDARRAHQ